MKRLHGSPQSRPVDIVLRRLPHFPRDDCSSGSSVSTRIGRGLICEGRRARQNWKSEMRSLKLDNVKLQIKRTLTMSELRPSERVVRSRTSWPTSKQSTESALRGIRRKPRTKYLEIWRCKNCRRQSGFCGVWTADLA